MLLLFAGAVQAQHFVTRFLGIPVDGSKSEMISKLKAKGLQYNQKGDILTGEFNGTNVTISVATTNNKVSRIIVCDVNDVDERSIQIRFNRLCSQFANNPKYKSLEDYTIPDNENISYEMTVNKKRYEAAFYQLQPAEVVKEEVNSILLSKYTEEQLANPTEEITKEIDKLLEEYYFSFSKRPVWFKISDYRGKYYIAMFYDNEYNRANGEDL